MYRKNSLTTEETNFTIDPLEPEDLAALTVEAAAMAKVPLAGTVWIPGVTP